MSKRYFLEDLQMNLISHVYIFKSYDLLGTTIMGLKTRLMLSFGKPSRCFFLYVVFLGLWVMFSQRFLNLSFKARVLQRSVKRKSFPCLVSCPKKKKSHTFDLTLRVVTFIQLDLLYTTETFLKNINLL